MQVNEKRKRDVMLSIINRDIQLRGMLRRPVTLD